MIHLDLETRIAGLREGSSRKKDSILAMRGRRNLCLICEVGVEINLSAIDLAQPGVSHVL